MDNKLIASWHEKEREYKPKESSWYWTVGIVSVGIAIASVIIQNYLFALISLLAGFAIMLVGTQRPVKRKYAFYERYVAIGDEKIPYDQIRKFAIEETDPKMLTLEIKNFVGVAHIPIGDADHRLIRTELKNRDIDEVESLDTFVAKVADWLKL